MGCAFSVKGNVALLTFNLTSMPPHEQFEQKVRELTAQGCTPDAAIQQVQQTYPNLVRNANEILKIKQKIVRDLLQ
jgi:hypothetical protein